jgi:hypothetical protein
MMNDKNQNTLQELNKFIAKLKNMNVIKAKEIATCHINIASHIANSMRKPDYKQVYELEGLSIMDDIKEIPRIIEGKMLKQYDKQRILRAFILLSTT